jgi:cytoskeletal protein RodZ
MTDTPIKLSSTDSISPLFTQQADKNKTTQPMQPELIFWYEAMRYGVVNLGNYSIHAKDTLFYYQTMDKEQFTPKPTSRHVSQWPSHTLHHSTRSTTKSQHTSSPKKKRQQLHLVTNSEATPTTSRPPQTH